MIPVEQVATIRRLFHAEHWKMGTIAAELGLHPDTVRRALDTDRFKRGPSNRRTLVEPYLDFIKQTLEAHPRLRATRIYEMIRYLFAVESLSLSRYCICLVDALFA